MAGLRVVTLNTWKGDGAYAARLDAMARGLAELRPDLVALQECLTAPEQGLDTARVLAEALGARAIVHAGRRKLRKVEGYEAMSTSGLAVLTRLPVMDVAAFPLPADPADGERDALRVVAQSAAGSVQFLCLHLTHLVHRGDLRQAQLRAALAGLNRMHATTVVAGDFNAGIAELDLPPGLQDCRQAVGAPPLSTLVDADKAVDHVLLARPCRWRVGKVERVLDQPGPGCVMASDHFGVMVELRT